MLPIIPKIDHAFRLSLKFKPPFRYPSTTGHRAALNIANGTAKGPKLDAKVADDGGELMVIRPDGVIDWDSRMMLRTADGAMVYWRARGNVLIGTEAARVFFETGDLSTSKLHLSPYFDAPMGPYDWMTRSCFVALGSMGADAAEIDVFQVTE